MINVIYNILVVITTKIMSLDEKPNIEVLIINWIEK